MFIIIKIIIKIILQFFKSSICLIFYSVKIFRAHNKLISKWRIQANILYESDLNLYCENTIVRNSLQSPYHIVFVIIYNLHSMTGFNGRIYD